jgi:Putative polyhydroxyalkanoic acid system protein (PHA_gran_rgn)
MQHLTATIPHQLSRAEAKQRIESQIGLLQQQPGTFTDLQTRWVQDTLEFSARILGSSLSGELRVDDHAVHLTVALPWFATLLAGTIRHQIEGSVRKALSGPSASAGKS